MSNQMSLSSLPHFNSSSTQVSMVTPLKELPWSHSSADNFHPPLNSTSHDIDIQTSTYLGLNSAPYNMVNNTPQSPSTTSSSHTSYYITSSSPNLDIYNPHSDSSSLSLQSFTSQPSQQHYPTTTNTTNMIHPMLLAPYYMSTTEVATVPHGFVYSTNMQNHERQQSDGSDFYLS
ncbi:hypothetical protein BDF20DRAFT_858790 [Mycotypha africana]|uniref:uncharacterized protein n=1 Tax=Mycotypha africana TaxID=64632 RepID=UPI0023014E28|nr:uncharacterized protein BDF20DRAFT_858790 [Mycotypha africana]KAI8984241.1 hypothetical protein BDF20DRAFT_858790 [Mycotypha africana]